MTEGSVTAARGRLGQSPYFALRGIECACRDGVVTLRRCLPSHYLKQITQETLASIDGITALVNDIEVIAPGASEAANREGYRPCHA